MVSDDKTDEIVDDREPTPEELAARGEGRKPAPLGSSEGEEG